MDDLDRMNDILKREDDCLSALRTETDPDRRQAHFDRFMELERGFVLILRAVSKAEGVKIDLSGIRPNR